MNKFAIVVVAAALPSGAFADARIEIDQNGIDTFHAPFDAYNTDNETKSMPQAASSVQNDDQNVYYGDAITEVRLQQAALRTIFLTYGDGQPEVTITHAEANEYGTLRVDGTTYNCSVWSATHKALNFVPPNIPKLGEVEISVVLTNCQ
jgi:hypothetical protein